MSLLTTLKKPLNAIEMPVYADIRGPAPRFVDSGKHWTVDVGKTQQQVEFMPDKLDYALLAQQRDYSERIYGVSSHKDVVNKNFRPPLLTLEDTVPLNKQPRGFVVPHTNPYSAGGGYHMQPRDTELITEFTASNDKQHYTTTRVKHGYTNPTYYRPVHTGGGVGGVVPDTKVRLKLPQTSVTTITSLPNLASPFQNGAENGLIKVRLLDPLGISASSGHKIPYQNEYRHNVQLDDVSYISTVAVPSIPYSRPLHQTEGPAQSIREDFVLLDQKPLTPLTAGPSSPTDISTRNSSYTDLIPKTELKNWRVNANLPTQVVGPLRTNNFGNTKRPSKEMRKPPMEPHRTIKYHAPVQNRQHQLKTTLDKTRSYETKGFVPTAGISIGQGGRGL